MMPFHLLNNQCDILIFLNLSLGWMHPRVVFTSSIMTAFCIQDSIGYFSQRGTLLVGVAGLGNTDSFVCMEKNDQTMAILQLIFVNTPNPQYRMPLCRRSQIGCFAKHKLKICSLNRTVSPSGIQTWVFSVTTVFEHYWWLKPLGHQGGLLWM